MGFFFFFFVFFLVVDVVDVVVVVVVEEEEEEEEVVVVVVVGFDGFFVGVLGMAVAAVVEVVEVGFFVDFNFEGDGEDDDFDGEADDILPSVGWSMIKRSQRRLGHILRLETHCVAC